MNDKVEVFYTIPNEKKVMIPVSELNDPEDWDEIEEYVREKIEDGNPYADDIKITSTD